MARYLIAIMLAIVAACAFSWPTGPRDARTYPETLGEGVTSATLNAGGNQLLASAPQYGLSTFVRHASAADGVRGRAGAFELLYHAPNRDPEAAAPYQPPSVPDRLLVIFDGNVMAEEAVPFEFAGAHPGRKLEMAQLNVGDKRFLLVSTRSESGEPLWFAIFTAKGKLLYRGGLPHNDYRFVEHADGISLLDDSGHGKRITLL